MTPTPAFISFDFDNDEDLKTLLVGQSRNSDSPFSIADWSLREAVPGNWKAEARRRIRRAEQVIVLCGTSTHTATGVSIEVELARDERKPYFLLNGRANLTCTKPFAALPSDKIYDWTWNNLKVLLRGAR